MSLHGTLETFALPDVMALLAATKKTGELRVVGERLDGRVHLDAGRVVAANVGRADSFVDAVFELLRLSTGKFSFDADQSPDNPSEPVDIEPLLLEASARLSEWREIEAVVPSLEHAVGLVGSLHDPHVTLAAEEWRMVVAVAASRCVSEVAEHLGLGEYSVCKALKKLVEAGVAEVADPPADAPKAAATPAPAPAAKPETATEPEPEPTVVDGAKVVIEPERKADSAVGKVDIPALTTKDEAPKAPKAEAKADAPAPKAEAPKPEPKSEPKKAEPAPAKAEAAPAKSNGVTASQAKALVSQLAALSGDKPEPAAAKAEESKKDAAQPEEAVADKPAEAAPGVEGGDTEEPLNRGLLLKFLSSVRQ